MPKIDLTLPKGAVDAETLAELPGQLAAALHKCEKAPDNELFRSLAWTHVHELDAAAIHTADGPADKPQFVVGVTVPEGGLSEKAIAGLAGEATALVGDAAGLPEEERIRIWVLVQEIDEGKWGAGGNVIRFEELRASLRAQREQAAAPAS